MAREMTNDEQTALVAEKIMGWTYDSGSDWYWSKRDGIMRHHMPAPDWDPRIRWDHAGMVIEKMIEKGFSCLTDSDPATGDYPVMSSAVFIQLEPFVYFDWGNAEKLPAAIFAAVLAKIAADEEGGADE